MNKKFIDKYGFMNFKSICETIPINLSILKNKRKIKGYKLSSRKKIAKIYGINGGSVDLEYAQIYIMKENDYKDLTYI